MIYILFVIIALVAVLNIINTFTIMKLEKAYNDTKDVEQLVCDCLKINNKAVEENNETLLRMFDREDEYLKLMSMISDQYDILKECYETLSEQHKALLKAWADVRDSYDNHYEIIKQTNDRLNDISHRLEDFAAETKNGMDEYYMTMLEACDTLCCDCPYEDPIDCKTCKVKEFRDRTLYSEEVEPNES